MRLVNCIHRQGLPLTHVSPARSYNFSLHINVPIFAAPQVSSAHQSKVLSAHNCTCINKPSAFELLLPRSDQSGPKSDSTSKRRSRPLSNQWPPFSSHSDGNWRDRVSHWKLRTSWQVANKKNCKKFSQRSWLRPDLSLCSELKKIGICACPRKPVPVGLFLLFSLFHFEAHLRHVTSHIIIFIADLEWPKGQPNWAFVLLQLPALLLCQWHQTVVLFVDLPAWGTGCTWARLALTTASQQSAGVGLLKKTSNHPPGFCRILHSAQQQCSITSSKTPTNTVFVQICSCLKFSCHLLESQQRCQLQLHFQQCKKNHHLISRQKSTRSIVIVGRWTPKVGF